MRRLAAALLALATLAAGAAPLAAHAQDKAKPAITKEQRDTGLKEAPAAVQKANLTCTVSDAYFLGKSSTGDKASIYEVACQQGTGYIVMASASGSKVYDCLTVAGSPSLACRLPGNADPKQDLKPYIASAGISCTPTAARYVGSNDTVAVFEAACQEGAGYILQAPLPGLTAATVAIPCIQASGKTACTLTSQAQNQAFLGVLASKAGRTCQVSGSRYLGSDQKSGVAYYELGCGAQPGFVLGANKAGGLDRVLSCTEAKGLSGGCTLTDETAVAAQETADYTRRVKAAGFDCDVSKTRSIGRDPSGGAVIEFACSNRPDGMVAVVPTSASGRVQLVDCVKAGEFGATGACELTTPTPVYAKYTAALVAKGRSSCKVSGARYLGRTPSNTDFVETACSDGKPGWVIELTQSDQVKQLLSCGQAKEAGLACQLPTNAKG